MSERVLILLLWTIVIIVFIMQLCMGSVWISVDNLLDILLFRNIESIESTIVLKHRLPSSLMAVFAGIALSLSGLMMQSLFRNPLAGPYVLGITSGSSLGVALFMMGSSAIAIPQGVFNSIGLIGSAFAGSLLVFGMVYIIWMRVQQSVAMLVVGLMLSGFVQSLIDILQNMSNSALIKSYVSWSFGSFNHAMPEDLVYVIPVVLVIVFLVYRKLTFLNLMLLGEQYAFSTGVDVNSFKKEIAFYTCLLAAVISAWCGPIAFVGLAAPHMARLVTGKSDHRPLFIPTLLSGILFCSVSNLIQHTGVFGFQLPLNALLSLTGAPFVIWLVLKRGLL